MSTRSSRSHRSHRSHGSHTSHTSHTSTRSYTTARTVAPSTVKYRKPTVIRARKVTGVRRTKKIRSTNFAGYHFHKTKKIHYAAGRNQTKHVKGLHHTASRKARLRQTRLFKPKRVAGRRRI